ncbi:hypothetical protein [Pseudomonas sp.]|uniref:hypothetical protein n=1 Tax=Pseudomonas sp. TaxID=306 RepID=UPI003FD71A23
MAKSNKAASVLTVQGKQVTGTIIAAYAKRIGSIDDVLSVWANAATLQVAVYGNRNWLDSLFTMPTLRLQSGELSKAGKEVFKYVSEHCPRIVWDKESKKFGLTKLVKDSILETHFVAVGAAKEGGDIISHRNKLYLPHGDFALTFSEFKNLEKAPKDVEEKEPSMTAKAFAKQAEKALDCFANQRFTGTPDELLAAALRAKELFLALDAAFDAATKLVADKAPDGVAVDQQMANQLDASGRNGKAKRAGGKVETKEAA